MKRNALLIPIALLVIAGSLGSLLLRWLGREKSNFNPDIALGQGVAEQTAQLLPEGGRIVVVAHRPEESRHYRVALEAFQKALENYPQLAVVATETVPAEAVPVDPDGLLMAEPLAAILAQYPDIDALVSLVGCANLGHGTASGELPLVIGYCSASGERLGRLLANGSLAVAIVPRWQAAPQRAALPRTPAEWFEYYYQVVTPETAGSLTTEEPPEEDAP